MRSRRAVALAVAALIATTAASATEPTSRVATARNENIVIGQINFWFPQFEYQGQYYTLEPKLGYYDSRDPAIIRQEIDWAADYGVDVFSVEWVSRAGEQNSMEPIMDQVFLKAPNLCRIRWVIFHDLPLRLFNAHVDTTDGFDFDDKRVRKLFIGDMVHFAKKYFDQPQYFKIGGRPVVYTWATRAFTGDVAGAVAAARRKVAKLGYDIYIVGDEIDGDNFVPAHAAIWDAVTSFIPFLSIGAAPPANAGAGAPLVDATYSLWERHLDGLKVLGRDDPVVLQPGFTPQYDDTRYRKAYDEPPFTYVPARSIADVRALARVSLAHANPAGEQGLKLIWLNTFNNWPETTTVEPTVISGPKYPAGNYGFDMLNVVRSVFGAQTYGTGVNSCPSR